jgi:hypothetical protein
MKANLYGLQLGDYSICLGYQKETEKYLFLERKPATQNEYELFPVTCSLQEIEKIGILPTPTNLAILQAASLEEDPVLRSVTQRVILYLWTRYRDQHGKWG